MNDHTTHVTEGDLILHYYGEDAVGNRVERHLASCAACHSEFARLRHVLALVDADGLAPADAPGPAFEREVWARLEPQLARRPSRFARWFGAPTWALAGGVAALVLVAFLAGRLSGPVTPAPTGPTQAANDVAERVLVLAVVDHLDQSQMVLLELLNGDDATVQADLEKGQLLARELVAANRLYRQTAVQTGDDQTSDVLDELERVLLEIANTPQGATKDDLDVLRARIASGGVLFKVRVVHSEMLERERKASIPGSRS